LTKAERFEISRALFHELTAFDTYHAKGSIICGTDEAGRGPLAGPVTAAAVVLPKNCELIGLNDSKKLSAKQRQVLYEQIMSIAIVGVATISPAEIDEINILQASLKAMQLAVAKLNEVTDIDIVLIDGTTLFSAPVGLSTILVPQGDSKSACIAAASIVAKVTRDSFMEQAALIYPEYGFEKHKGYGTAAHYAAIKEYGICPIHRRTFLRSL